MLLASVSHQRVARFSHSVSQYRTVRPTPYSLRSDSDAELPSMLLPPRGTGKHVSLLKFLIVGKRLIIPVPAFPLGVVHGSLEPLA